MEGDECPECGAEMKPWKNKCPECGFDTGEGFPFSRDEIILGIALTIFFGLVMLMSLIDVPV